MRAVDTNVLVRLITRDDEDQVKAAEAFVRKGAWVSHLVLAETTWVLITGYELKHDQVATAIEMLPIMRRSRCRMLTLCRRR
jgi:predicted nucleic-acid-binding protein